TAQERALQLAHFFAGFGRDEVAPDALHDVFRWVGMVGVRRSDRPAYPDPVIGKLVDEDPPAESVGQSEVISAATGEVFDLARPCSAYAKTSPRVMANYPAIGFARSGVDCFREGVTLMKFAHVVALLLGGCWRRRLRGIANTLRTRYPRQTRALLSSFGPLRRHGSLAAHGTLR